MAATATDEKIAADLTDFRVDAEKRFGSVEKTIEGFRGEVKTDLRWIKGIGAALILAALSFGGWIIAEIYTVRTQLDTLIKQTAPKVP